MDRASLCCVGNYYANANAVQNVDRIVAQHADEIEKGVASGSSDTEENPAHNTVNEVCSLCHGVQGVREEH